MTHTMALPMDSLPSDDDGPQSEQNYKITCMDFIQDISNDYKAWVDYYKLPPQEDASRRDEIDGTITRTNQWIAKVGTTIKSIDVIMNDGIQKMAEATAGKPFPIGVFVNKTAGYCKAGPGAIPVRVRATGREGRQTRLGFHFHNDLFRVESTCPVTISGDISSTEYDDMDISLTLHADSHQRDVISFTITVCETENGTETERRGVSTIIHVM